MPDGHLVAGCAQAAGLAMPPPQAVTTPVLPPPPTLTAQQSPRQCMRDSSQTFLCQGDNGRVLGTSLPPPSHGRFLGTRPQHLSEKTSGQTSLCKAGLEIGSEAACLRWAARAPR